MAHLHIEKPLAVEGLRLFHAPLHDHAEAVPGLAVARRTEDIVSFLPPLQHFDRHRSREIRGKRAVDFARVEMLVQPQVAPGNGPRHRGTHRTPIAEEVALLEGLGARLIVHVLPAGRRGGKAKDAQDTGV